jgi:hypothetical protein
MKYPAKKDRDLTEEEKRGVRARIEELEKGVTEQIAKEFRCSPSQIAGIKARMHRRKW